MPDPLSAADIAEGQAKLALLRHALMRKVWRTPPVPDGLDTLVVAERILSDPELLDALAVYRGWRPPPRVIETAAELDALPELVVIRTDEGRVIEKVGSFPDPDRFGYRSDWMGMESEFTFGTDEIDDLPATVLWTPGEVGR